jgi:TolB-like protein
MNVDPKRSEEVAFGPFRLDVQGRTLKRDGESVVLGTRSLDILCALTASRGDLVTKDELMARIWSGLVVEDNTIQVHISALRKALGEGSGGPRYILTVPGQGYRFIGEPDRSAPASATQQDAPSLPDKPSIAVLPFQNMSSDAEHEYFADGVVEDIITALTRFPALFVIARNSSFTYKGRSVDIRQVGRELGVRYVLEGSIRRSESRIRITGQLIDALSGTHLWADRFDGELRDVFDLQDEIATKVVGAIAPKLEQVETDRARGKPTDSLQAYDYYLRGRACFHRERQNTNVEAMHLFAKAIERDPDFASAYGMAAQCYSQRLRAGWMKDHLQEKLEARRLAWHAAELGKDDALALALAGGVLALVVHEVEAGAELIDRALGLNPNLAFGWGASAWVRVWLGEPGLAIEHALRGIRLSPPRSSASHDANRYGIRAFHRWPVRRGCLLRRKITVRDASLPRDPPGSRRKPRAGWPPRAGAVRDGANAGAQSGNAYFRSCEPCPVSAPG